MKTSVTFQVVMQAMAEARAEMPPIVMDRENPYFKSMYATLGAVIETIQPMLDKHKLSIISVPEGDGVNVGVTTRVSHYPSGEYVEATTMVPLKGGSEKTQIVQVAGIDFSYLRRYQINALFNLYAEQDTDGNIDGYERAPKYVNKPKGKSAKRHVPVEVEDEAEGPSLEDLADEFGHAYNKCVALGNPEAELPKLPKKSTWTEAVLLEKIAEINLILKASEEE